MPEPEQGERCQLCGSPVEVVSSDEGTSYYRPVGNVETQAWREQAERVRKTVNRGSYEPSAGQWTAFFDEKSRDGALAALDALTTQIKELERERDEAQTVIENMGFPGPLLRDALARAEKAERALAETLREALEKIAQLTMFTSPEDAHSTSKGPHIARAALRPSEKASDES